MIKFKTTKFLMKWPRKKSKNKDYIEKYNVW